MIKTIIKRDGSQEQFDPKKLNGWGIWASKSLGRYVDWAEIVLHVNEISSESVTSTNLQKSLISFCLTKSSWAHHRMAGRLHAALLYKEMYNDKIPTVKDLFAKLVSVDLMAKSFYDSWTDDEWIEINNIIDHKIDLTYAYYQIKQITKKYSLQDRVSGILYETPQFTYMRVAMRMAMNRKNRIERIRRNYRMYSSGKVNIPTPYFTNSGTKQSGFQSCCVHNTNDTIPSLAADNHISYMMTVASAGQGSKIYTRTLGSPIRGGAIIHQGKAPYYRAEVGMINANLQNGRGGAETQYYDCFDPEIESIQKFKNPMTPELRQIRGLDYAMCYNDLFAEKAAKLEKVALFDFNKVPDLYNAMVLKSQTIFNMLYEKYVKEEKYERMIDARDALLTTLSESTYTGRHYVADLSEANRHTPFREPIRMSNLCVTGDTQIFIKIDNIEYNSTIKNVIEYTGPHQIYVKCFNHKKDKTEYKLITAKALTYPNAKLVEVITNNGSIKCTPDHSIFTTNAGYIPAEEINAEDTVLIHRNGQLLSENVSIGQVISVNHIDETQDVYDITVEDNHNFFANDILIHNCTEIFLVTYGYDNVTELYQETDLSFVKFATSDNERRITKGDDFYNTSTGKKRAIFFEVGDILLDHDNVTITELIEVRPNPETGMCSLAGIVVSKIESEQDYEDAAFVALDMIYTGITESEYPLPQIKYTATKRMSAGVGILGLAHHLAKKGLKYSTQSGRDEIHEVAETHYWHLLNASLKLSEEFGNAEWIDKTLWTEGWTPLDTYNKNVDDVVTVENKRDWTAMSKRIIANGGHAFSVLAATPPTESSSLSAGTTNGPYPIRELDLNKTNDTDILEYVVPDSDILKDKYEFAWDVDVEDIAKVYGILQKWTDQGISCDLWYKCVGDETIPSNDILRGFFAFKRFGVKSRYYINLKTSKGIDLNSSENDADCAGCKL